MLTTSTSLEAHSRNDNTRDYAFISRQSGRHGCPLPRDTNTRQTNIRQTNRDVSTLPSCANHKANRGTSGDPHGSPSNSGDSNSVTAIGVGAVHDQRHTKSRHTTTDDTSGIG
ncbi:MAG: hypothetical protein ACJARS_001268 [bacterium]|jgi:hypothetical protein